MGEKSKAKPEPAVDGVENDKAVQAEKSGKTVETTPVEVDELELNVTVHPTDQGRVPDTEPDSRPIPQHGPDPERAPEGDASRGTVSDDPDGDDVRPNSA